MRRFLLIFMSVLISTVAMAQRENEKLTPEQLQLQKLLLAGGYIRSFYVDSVNNEKLTEDAIRGMLKELDPHSTYTNAEETRKLNEPLQGNFDGVGVSFNVLEDTLVVLNVISGGPSQRAGIVSGDRFISVDDTIIAGRKVDRNDMVRRLRGERGTHVKIGVKRGSDTTLVYFDIVRDKIPMNTVEAVYMIRPEVGYIRLSSFGANTSNEMAAALDSLKGLGCKSLLLDLQQNGGGYLNAAQGVAGLFLHDTDVVVSTRGMHAAPSELYALCVNKKSRFEGKLVVLVDEYTASAAEIVSGAVQDHDRGTIVGRRTFGKGLVQRPCYFPDGSMMRLTISRYYTPTGRCIQKPYEKGHSEDYAKDMERRLKSGELTCRDSIHFADSLKYYTLNERRTVYGGGGIMPDVFVPLDTISYTKYHRTLAAKNCILTATLKYVDRHRADLSTRFADVEAFVSGYELDNEMWSLLEDEAVKAKVEKPKDKDELELSRRKLDRQIKALIARDLWDMNAYFRIWNEDSDIVKEALKQL